MFSLEEVEECKNENPDHIDKVPVQTGILDLISRIFAHRGPNRNDGENRDTAENVKPVKTGDDKEARRKLRYSPWIMGQPRPFFNQMTPLESLATQENESADDCQSEKSESQF